MKTYETKTRFAHLLLLMGLLFIHGVDLFVAFLYLYFFFELALVIKLHFRAAVCRISYYKCSLSLGVQLGCYLCFQIHYEYSLTYLLIC
ncbi:hypothetical protein XELAEV_18007569mg [Xenopus laevis]|uniref:Uncharacterized protein n=1 Tax=Xenopus laevis TaxID=8355 RepID=A0A974I5I5_XENLA|nr:hypothetical protein XELAEV_18007569mg [Xenopus laevis]